jgi:Flp pilus assembly pilin Flp
MKSLKRLFYRIDGQGLVEYAIIIGLVAMIVGLTLRSIGLGVEGLLDFISRGLDRLPRIFGP